MSKVETCPVSHTCADINDVINIITPIQKKLEDLEHHLSSYELRCMIDQLKSLHDGNNSNLEELRTANEKLRDWGTSASENLEEAEYEIERLEQQVENLTDDLKEAKEEIEKLKKQVSSQPNFSSGDDEKTKDYEFNLKRGWSENSDNDPYGSTIKHFQD